MTRSELHAVMVGGYATIAGAVLAAYIMKGVSLNQKTASFKRDLFHFSKVLVKYFYSFFFFFVFKFYKSSNKKELVYQT